MTNSSSNTNQRVAFIQACWHRDIVDQLRDSFKLSFADQSDLPVDYFELPGAYEIPLLAKKLAESGNYAAIVGAGLVVDGGIYRHDFVGHAVIDGFCLLYTSPSPRDLSTSRMPSSA